MSRLDEFLRLLCGRFDNTRQLEGCGGAAAPPCRWQSMSTPCATTRLTASPRILREHLCWRRATTPRRKDPRLAPSVPLYGGGEAVKLTSYQLPKAADGGAATYETPPPLKWEDLEISEKFTPALYTLHDGVWEGGSVSMFSPVLKFTLYEAILSGVPGGGGDHGGERKADVRVRCAHRVPESGGLISREKC